MDGSGPLVETMNATDIAASYDYYNFAETPAAASAVLPPASYRRLQKIKAACDPDQVIISTHPAWPARP